MFHGNYLLVGLVPSILPVTLYKVPALSTVIEYFCTSTVYMHVHLEVHVRNTKDLYFMLYLHMLECMYAANCQQSSMHLISNMYTTFTWKCNFSHPLIHVYISYDTCILIFEFVIFICTWCTLVLCRIIENNQNATKIFYAHLIVFYFQTWFL